MPLDTPSDVDALLGSVPNASLLTDRHDKPRPKPDAEAGAGMFNRAETGYHSWVTASGESGFKAEPGRYHLYVSYACPWASRTLAARAIKGLEDCITVDVVNAVNTDEGWSLAGGEEGATGDTVNGKRLLRDVYLAARPAESVQKTGIVGRVTVPVLWDRVTKTIVNNESSEIIRMLNSEFNSFAKFPHVDLYPSEPAVRALIDHINAFVYPHINDGVYRCGFATTQDAYDSAFDRLFAAMDALEVLLERQRYLCGSNVTEADIRLFVTLVRFDHVYVNHFKTNGKKLIEYPNLWAHTRDIYQLPGIAATVNITHIKRHYYLTHKSINPLGIIPKGPLGLDFNAAHNRDKRQYA